MELGSERLPNYIAKLLTPVCSVLSDQRHLGGDNLYDFAGEVSEMMKKIVGRDNFASSYATVLKNVTVIRDSRKRKKALNAVTNPEINARRKI